MSTEPWVGWVSVRPGRLTYAGILGPAADHAHHAVQLLVTAGEPFVLQDGAGALLVLVDPFSTAGRALGDGASGGSGVASWREVPGGDGGRWDTLAAAEEFVDAVAAAGGPVTAPPT